MTTYRASNHAGGVTEGRTYSDDELNNCAFCCVGTFGCPLHPQPEPPEERMTFDEASAHLTFRFPDLQINVAGGACPFQADGTLHGLPFYFRFRHNWAELRILSDAGWFKPLYTAGCEYGDGEDQGWLEPTEFVELMIRLIGELERAPIMWEFPGVEIADVGCIKAGDPHCYGAWGHTPEQAWAAMHEPSKYLRSKGIDDATQAQWVAARKMSAQTITTDDRVFPNPDPFAKDKP